MFRCLGLVTVIGLTFGLLSYAFAEPLLGIYLPNDPEAIAFGKTRLLFLAVPYFLCGTMEVMVGGQRGMGLSLIPMVNALIGSCLLRIVWVFAVFPNFKTLECLYLSYPVSWSLTALIQIVFYLTRRKKAFERNERLWQTEAA